TRRVGRSAAAAGARRGTLALATHANSAAIAIAQNEFFSIPTGTNSNRPFDITGGGGDELDLKLVDSGPSDRIEIETKSGDDFFLLDGAGDPNFSAFSLIDGSRSSAGDTVSLADLSSNPADFGEPDVSGFLGLSLLIGGNRHFAWIEASVTEDQDTGGLTVQISRSGFEDVPGVGILAGSTQSLAAVPLPGSLLLLASGAVGLAALRRRRNGAAS
ncbi:MAG: VPLPA-CTERM sorting domain-containing protein, partial [Pseudomonadota bacterium]